MRDVTKFFLLNAPAIVALCCLVDGAVKTWKYDSDIFNPDNWEGGKPAEHCRGLIFPRDFRVTTFINTLYAEEIELPFEGQIAINDGGFIELNNNPKCIKLKSLDYHGLHDPQSWDNGGNVATPDIEKIPCGYDDVIFPKGLNSPILIEFDPLYLRSVKFQNTTIDEGDFNDYLNHAMEHGDVIQYYSDYPYVTESHKICLQDTDCVCENYPYLFLIYELYGKKEKTADCLYPIQVAGNFAPSCGATVVFEPEQDFELKRFWEKLKKDDDIDVHVSRINAKQIQAVFADKQRYSGKSVEFAKDVSIILAKDANALKIHSVKLQYSGEPLSGDENLSSVTMTILSLFFVVAIFGGVYAAYYGPLKDYDVWQRLSLWPRTRFTTSIFARYDRNNEEDLILEGESIAGSVMNLSRSFDNPLYGTPTPSTSASTDTTLGEPKSETMHENPLYEITEKETANDDVVDAEE